MAEFKYPLEYYEFFVKFNEGDYYTCHDLLEEMWMNNQGNLFLKGLLQLCVALYHYSYGNVKGTRAMLLASKRYLEPYRPYYWDLDVEKVNNFIENCLTIIPYGIEKVPYEHVKNLPELPPLYLYLQE